MSLSEISTLKVFLSKQYRICYIQWNVQHVFQISADFAPISGALLLKTEPSFAPPPKKNKILDTIRP